VNPFAFKWILSEPKKVKPYFEIEGGTLFTNTKVRRTHRRLISPRAARWVCISWERNTIGARRSAVHAHIECRDDHAESGDQYDSGADRVGNFPEVSW